MIRVNFEVNTGCYLILVDVGYHVPQDSQKSRELFEVAAEKGNSASMVNLGFFYERGKGVQQDYMKAVNYYRVGGEKGNTGGLYNLAGNSL